MITISKLQSYDAIAGEYYIKDRHPTCANFGELSAKFIRPRLERVIDHRRRVLEVGAGRSTAAPIMFENGFSLNHLLLSDRSQSMLFHSKHWVDCGAQTLVADALETGLRDASFDLIVASLGDPYNCDIFWREIYRLLRPGGSILFTTPAFEWASRFRDRDDLDTAEFIAGGGKSVKVPSHVYPAEQQIEMIAKAGLVVSEAVAFYIHDLADDISPKLMVFNDSETATILLGFTASAE